MKIQLDEITTEIENAEVVKATPAKIEVNRDALRELKCSISAKFRTRDLLSFHNYADNFHTWERPGLSPLALNAERRELRQLFNHLAATARFYLGAASMLRLRGSRLIGHYAFIDEGDGETLLDLTLDELTRQVPATDRKRLDAYRQEETDRANSAETKRKSVSSSQSGLDRKIAALQKEKGELEKKLAAEKQRADKAERERDELRDVILKAQ